jgi:glycosyltransferase involved in cell wall biosynthesis
MRVAHLGSKGVPSKGGTERVVEAIATRLATRHEVTVYGQAPACRPGWYRGVRVVARTAPAGKHLGPVILQLRCTLHALARGRYDIVHVHGSENGFVVPLLRLRYPVVSTSHGPAYERAKWGSLAKRLLRCNERWSVRDASRATAVAANQAVELSARYGRPVRHIPNGIDAQMTVDLDGAQAMLRGLGLTPGQYVLFAAARVDPTKGCHTLIEAVRGMETELPLLVVGDLGHAAGYEDRLRELAGGMAVTFIPRLDDKAVVLGLLAHSRAYVFPSTVEAMSMMLLEALAVGVVGLASDIPENTAILPPGYPVFAAGNADDLARQLARGLAVSDADGERLKAEGRKWVRTHYDWDGIARRYEDLYAEVLAQESQRGGLQGRTSHSV